MRRLNRRVCRSGREFQNTLNALIDASNAETEEIVRASVIGLYGELVDKIPKDTARAASGFVIDQQPSEWAPPPGDYKTELARIVQENIDRVGKLPPGASICIFNNVEYLLALENGHSVQAPTGFIALAMRWWTSDAQKMLDKWSREKL